MSISPEGRDCLQYWTDEVREPPTAETLFTLTPGLELHTKALTASARPEQTRLAGGGTTRRERNVSQSF